MLIEQKIEVNGQKVTITRTVQYADKTAAAAPPRPPDILATPHAKPTDEEVKQKLLAAQNAQQQGAATPATPAIPQAGGAVRLYVLRPGGDLAPLGPGGDLAPLGPGGDLADLGPGGNLSSGLTLIFGGVSVQCCCHRDETPGSSATE